ncbi:hypothetical protein I6F21_13910 [Bradyrhizobium sp. NBAIM03]|nr:hypothetical protein [Bradyrhizobium sp. IC4060]MCA1497335.1 hypothetical protein [Bradyrhizobium sp. NBAIM14]MCA1533657.1 hypothetical protein [Bradyrhizobium sp. NBAIM03]
MIPRLSGTLRTIGGGVIRENAWHAQLPTLLLSSPNKRRIASTFFVIE